MKKPPLRAALRRNSTKRVKTAVTSTRKTKMQQSDLAQVTLFDPAQPESLVTLLERLADLQRAQSGGSLAQPLLSKVGIKKENYLEKTLRNSSTETILAPLYFFSSSKTLSPETMYSALASLAKYRNWSSVGSFSKMFNVFFGISKKRALGLINSFKIFGIDSLLFWIWFSNFGREITSINSDKVSSEKQISIEPSLSMGLISLLRPDQRKAEIRTFESKITFILVFEGVSFALVRKNVSFAYSSFLRRSSSFLTALISSSSSFGVISLPISLIRETTSSNVKFSLSAFALSSRPGLTFLRIFSISSRLISRPEIVSRSGKSVFTTLETVFTMVNRSLFDRKSLAEEPLNSSLISFGNVRVPSFEILTRISFIRDYFMPNLPRKQHSLEIYGNLH